LCQIIEPVWWERVPAGNGLDSVSQRLTSFTEVFAFFDPENVNIIELDLRRPQLFYAGIGARGTIRVLQRNSLMI